MCEQKDKIIEEQDKTIKSLNKNLIDYISNNTIKTPDYLPEDLVIAYSKNDDHKSIQIIKILEVCFDTSTDEWKYYGNPRKNHYELIIGLSDELEIIRKVKK
jgi:hypothetical protein